MEPHGKDDNIFTGFREVFRFLSTKTCSVPDDAILHIFIDVLEKILSKADHDSFISSGVVDFLENAAKTTELCDPIIVVFGLRLCSFLGRTAEKFQEWSDVIQKFIGRVWRCQCSAGSLVVSVLTALYSCLSTVCMHNYGLKWILTQYNECIGHSFVLLETGSSIFLEKAIIDFLSRLVLCPDNFDCMEKMQTTRQYICDTICQSVHHHANKKSDSLSSSTRVPILNASLKLTENLIRSRGPVCDKLIANREFLKDFMKVLQTSSGQEMEICLHITELLVEHGVHSGVIELMEGLWMEGDMQKSLKLLTRVFHRMTTIDQSSETRCQQILTAPLWFVTGKERASCWTDVLKTKPVSRSLLTNLLSISLSYITQAKLTKEAALILELFGTTVQEENSSEFSELLLHNRKLQRSCLQYFYTNGELLDSSDIVLWMASIVRIMQQLNVDSVTYSLCTKCMHNSLPVLLSQSTKCASTSEDLARVLQRHLCSLHWELRDTTVEFLGKVLQEYQDSDCVMTWLQTNSFHMQIWQCVQDGESYVRASAITSLWHVYTSRQLWTSLLKVLSSTEMDIVAKVVSVLDSDAEAFARRSAASFLLKYRLESSPSPSLTDPLCSLLLKTFLKSLNDFDWEVQICALNFLDSLVLDRLTLISADVPVYASELGNGKGDDSNNSTLCNNKVQAVCELCYTGCFSQLLHVLDDFDEKVCERACEVVINCQKKINDTFQVTSMTLKNIEDMFTKVGNVQEGRDILDEDNFQHKNKRLKPNSPNSCTNEHEEDCTKKFASTVHSIIDFNPKSYSVRFDSKTDYYANPMSLIQDILSYASKDEEDNMVDCY